MNVLYESVITPEQRHDLGEYYTPDWLAAKMVERVVPEPLITRVLDPACGSGTFLFHCVRRYLDAADTAGTAPADALAGVTAHPTRSNRTAHGGCPDRRGFSVTAVPA